MAGRQSLTLGEVGYSKRLAEHLGGQEAKEREKATGEKAGERETVRRSCGNWLSLTEKLG